MSSWWSIETAVADGHLTLREAQTFAAALIAEHVAERLRDRDRRARFLRERGTIDVPRDPTELELLHAVYDAVEQGDEQVRGYTWWREAEARGEDPAAQHRDYLGVASCDKIAAALAGVPISEVWKLRRARRVVRPLQLLLARGLVCRGERNGVPYGYELTDAGASLLRDELEVAF